MRCLAALTLVCLLHVSAQADTFPRQPGVDALHYVFRLTLGDDSNEVRGEATVNLRFVADNVREVFLDLASTSGGKGMTVSTVTRDGLPVSFTHQNDRLHISFPSPLPVGGEVSVIVQYHGVPADGLRLIANMHGERTAFSESWPNRARQWLPMIDHPYDKATGEFIVTAPAHYQVVANGLLVEEVDLPAGWRRTHYRQSAPIASWLYALGMARFAVHHAGTVRGVPLQSWVFPQDQEVGYRLFETTTRQAVEFFSERIGPYPYEKIANVQAAGIAGDTEHATIIFYGEKGVASGSGAVVHEVAHQWWGNAVTQSDWDDVWLSEGFATYFTHLFRERYEGREAFVSGMKADVTRIMRAGREFAEHTGGSRESVGHGERAELVCLFEGQLGAAYAARTSRHRRILGWHSPVLFASPGSECLHGRLQTSDGARLRPRSGVVLSPVAESRGSTSARRHLELQRRYTEP